MIFFVQIVHRPSMLDFKGPFDVDVSDDVWQTKFVGAGDKASREQLGIALLVGVGFNHLMSESVKK